MCEFNEYVQGPRAVWPNEEQVQDFESRKAPWPYKSLLPKRCNCGILAKEGVVPSELGYGWYCGNAIGKYWVSDPSRSFAFIIFIFTLVIYELYFFVAGGQDVRLGMV